jgi:hypothetical protein
MIGTAILLFALMMTTFALISARAQEPDNTLYLQGGRFEVTVDWVAIYQGMSGPGIPVSLTSDSGYFWFFSNNNVELLVKVLDATTIDGHFWVFWGSMTDVEYTITVTDTMTGLSKQYFGVQGVQQSGYDQTTF